MDHVDGCSDLLVDCIELCQNNTVYCPWCLTLCKINQGLVELRELVNRIIAYKGLTNE